MGTLGIAVVVWAGVAIAAIWLTKIGTFFDAMLPPIREKDIWVYAIFAVWVACLAGIAILFLKAYE